MRWWEHCSSPGHLKNMKTTPCCIWACFTWRLLCCLSRKGCWSNWSLKRACGCYVFCFWTDDDVDCDGGDDSDDSDDHHTCVITIALGIGSWLCKDENIAAAQDIWKTWRQHLAASEHVSLGDCCAAWVGKAVGRTGPWSELAAVMCSASELTMMLIVMVVMIVMIVMIIIHVWSP